MKGQSLMKKHGAITTFWHTCMTLVCAPQFSIEMLLDCIDFPDNVNVSLFERRVKLRHSGGVCVSAQVTILCLDWRTLNKPGFNSLCKVLKMRSVCLFTAHGLIEKDEADTRAIINVTHSGDNTRSPSV